jgi:hypothetical protein
MAHFDSVVIIGRRLHDVKEVFTSLVKQSNKMGSEINNKKKKDKIYDSIMKALTMEMGM